MLETCRKTSIWCDKANILYHLLAFLSIKMSIKCEVTQKLLIVTEDNKLYLFYQTLIKAFLRKESLTVHIARILHAVHAFMRPKRVLMKFDKLFSVILPSAICLVRGLISGRSQRPFACFPRDSPRKIKFVRGGKVENVIRLGLPYRLNVVPR